MSKIESKRALLIGGTIGERTLLKQRRPTISEEVLTERAGKMVEKLGADASLEAAMLADQALEAGDIDETVMWLAAIRHIDRLLSGSATVH